jgi:hypothetical protein
MQQHLGRRLADDVLASLERDGIQLYFDHLQIKAEALDGRFNADLPSRGGAFLRRRSALASGTVNRIRANSVLGG